MKQLNYVTISTVTWLFLLHLCVILSDSTPLSQQTGSCFCNGSAELRLSAPGLFGASYSCIEFNSMPSLDFNLANIGSSDQCSRSEPIELILNHNQIPILNNTLFHKFFTIARLDLSENQIEHMTSNAFSALINLRYCDLSNNRIRQIDSQFDHSFSLNRLNLSNNRISWIEDHAFRNLINLTSLDLSNNELVVIKTHTLAGLVSLSFLNLNTNRLQVIERDAFQDFMAKVRKIRLQNNQLVCDCNLRWLIDLSQEFNRNLMGKLFCASPPELNRIRFNSINSQELSCDHDLQLERFVFHSTANLTEGQHRFQLNCQAADAKQLTTIRILKEEKLLADGSNLFPGGLNGRAQVNLYRPPQPAWTGNELHANFTIVNVQHQDAGQYRCVVITPYGKAVKSVVVHVHKMNISHETAHKWWRWFIPFLTAFPLLISCLVYTVHYSLIEMPTRTKHLLINVWLRLAILCSFLHLYPHLVTKNLSSSSSSSSAPYTSNFVDIVLSFFFHYTLNTSQLWQVFQVFALYQLVTTSDVKRPVPGHASVDACRPFILYYVISLFVCGLISLWQTYATGVYTVFGFFASEQSVLDKISPLVWTMPAVMCVIQMTISVLIVALVNQFHSSNNNNNHHHHHQFNFSASSPHQPDLSSPLWKASKLLNDSNDLYWSYGKQLQVQWIQLTLTLTMIVVAFVCSSPLPSSISPRTRPSFLANRQSEDSSTGKTIYDQLLEKSDLNAEQMQNLQNWLSQLQKSHEKRLEPLAKQQQEQSNIEPIELDQLKTGSWMLGHWLNEHALTFSSFMLSLYVLIRFVLMREDVRVAMISGGGGGGGGGVCGWCFGCCLDCNGKSLIHKSTDTMQRAKVKAMREQLRRSAVMEAEKSDRPLLLDHRLLSGMDSGGAFSSQPSCTITQSLSSSSGRNSGHGLIGSVRGTLCRSTVGSVHDATGPEQQLPVNVEMSQPSVRYLNQEQMRQHIHYETIEVNPSLIQQNFWNLLQPTGEHEKKDEDTRQSNASNSSRVHLLGGSINNRPTHLIINRPHLARVQGRLHHRAFDDSFLEGDGSYLLNSTSKAQSDIVMVGRRNGNRLTTKLDDGCTTRMQFVKPFPVQINQMQSSSSSGVPFATDFERAYAQRRTQNRTQIPLEYVPPTRSAVHSYAQSELRPSDAMSCISTRSQPPRMPRKYNLSSARNQIHYTQDLVFGPPLRSKNNKIETNPNRNGHQTGRGVASDRLPSSKPFDDERKQIWTTSAKPLLICGPNLITPEANGVETERMQPITERQKSKMGKKIELPSDNLTGRDEEEEEETEEDNLSDNRIERAEEERTAENLYERIESMILINDNQLKNEPNQQGGDHKQEDGCEKSHSIAFVGRDVLTSGLYAKASPLDNNRKSVTKKLSNRISSSKPRRKKRKGLNSFSQISKPETEDSSTD